MPKDKGKKAKQPQSHRQSARRRIPALIWAAIGGGATLLSYLAVIQLAPNISIEPYATQDPRRPFAEQFYLQNTSIYTITDVHPNCGIDNVRAGNLTMRDFSVVNILDFSRSLSPGAKTTITCVLDRLFADTPEKYGPLNIELWVTFKAPLGFPVCKSSKFNGLLAADGMYIWIYRGYGTCDFKRPN